MPATFLQPATSLSLGVVPISHALQALSAPSTAGDAVKVFPAGHKSNAFFNSFRVMPFALATFPSQLPSAAAVHAAGTPELRK
jgi:hypothetical protein